MKKHLTKKEKNKQYVKEIQARDIDYSLVFEKDGIIVKEIKMIDDSADSISAATAEFESLHNVTSWRKVADNRKPKKFDAG